MTSNSTTPMADMASQGSSKAASRASDPEIVRRSFDAWTRGDGSIYDLMEDDAEVVIPGSMPHCGTFRKDTFLRETATPFMSRFRVPPAPIFRSLWSNDGGDGGIVIRADATGELRDGRAYRNDYIFVFEMAAGRVTRLTEFLDMAAFNAAWDGIHPDADNVG